jgi:hypothetical protein
MTHSRTTRAYAIQPPLISITRPALCRSKCESEQNPLGTMQLLDGESIRAIAS